MTCFECGNVAEHDHHVVPVVRGGTKTVPLCHKCHGRAHDRHMNPRALTIAGLKLARERGVRLGRPPTVFEEKRNKILDLFLAGKSYREISAETGCAHSSIGRVIKSLDPKAEPKRIDQIRAERIESAKKELKNKLYG